jgi:hypothetical protein
MKKNIGKKDRLIRLIAGIVLLFIAYFISNWFGVLIGLIGVFCIFQAAVSWCVVYQYLGKNTCDIRKK